MSGSGTCMSARNANRSVSVAEVAAADPLPELPHAASRPDWPSTARPPASAPPRFRNVRRSTPWLIFVSLQNLCMSEVAQVVAQVIVCVRGTGEAATLKRRNETVGDLGD